MKRFFLPVMALLAALDLASGQSAMLVSNTHVFLNAACPEMAGAWEFDLPDQKGLWFHDGSRYLWILTPKEDMRFAQDEPSSAEKAGAY